MHKSYQNRSTSPLCGEAIAVTLLERSNRLPPSNATRSESSWSCLIPKSLSRLVDARAYACRLFTRPLDSKPAYVHNHTRELSVNYGVGEQTHPSEVKTSVFGEIRGSNTDSNEYAGTLQLRDSGIGGDRGTG